MTNEEEFRSRLVEALERELVGPDLPPYGTELQPNETYSEVLQESPMQRYSAGVLFPRNQEINEVETSEEVVEETSGSLEEVPPTGVDEKAEDIEHDGRMNDELADAYDETIRMANEFYPSAMGLTFITEYPDTGLVINTSAAVYASRTPADPAKKLREWHRSEVRIDPVLLRFSKTETHNMQKFDLADNLMLRAIYHRRDEGLFLVTVSVLNTRAASLSKPPSGADCFFQVGLCINDPQNRHIFKEYRGVDRAASGDIDDPEKQEEAALDLLYRKRNAYAAGHGCSADWGDESNGYTDTIKTAVLPRLKVPPIEPRTEGGAELSMFNLSGADGDVLDEEIPALLENLVADYEHWVSDRALEAKDLQENLRMAASQNLELCRDCLTRIRAGIDLLKSDSRLMKAFMLANKAMLMQQYHSRRKKRSVNGHWEDLPLSYRPENGSRARWRTFQLAFVLMNLSSIVPLSDHLDHDDREFVDLIWFPTGGGKTEAYLGLAACDIFFRRLTRPSNAGCTVLMRYTLRLLTAQQFQRASSMICACELIRRDDTGSLGEEPITIGLWVGESLTPTYRDQALRALNNLANKRNQAENVFQLLKCPWCGTALDDQDNLGYVSHKFSGKQKTVIFVCPERRCPFSKRHSERNESHGLPVMVIDEDIYEWPPTLIIGTVDKFAMLAWREHSGRIFGICSDEDYDPPDLIIQDELHLIAGPLGSVVGLYESAIDLLCSWKGRRPKVVASTATIRRAWHQCKALYNRPIFQFPPQGLDISDSYFAKENPEAPGRIYVGVFGSAAPSFVTAMVRVLGALFQSCYSLPLPAGATESTRDPYWTLLQYFNSLRELGHAATLVEADIPEYMWAIASRSHLPKDLCRNIGSPVELTSRRTADEIPEILERLSVSYPRDAHESTRPLDTLLATNMISVGIDVDRLGLMVVIGQPKTTSEYIQASSRIGRSHDAPGLVVTMYNPGKPRDRSHYEHFRSYHAAFYKHVEPTSVTPFSLPVIERALHAVLVILIRHFIGIKSPAQIDPSAEGIARIREYIEDRCSSIDSEHTVALIERLSSLLKEWSDVRPAEWGKFGPPPVARPLMYPAGTEPLKEWDDTPWPTPSSMRNIDVECEAMVIATYETNE